MLDSHYCFVWALPKAGRDDLERKSCPECWVEEGGSQTAGLARALSGAISQPWACRLGENGLRLWFGSPTPCCAWQRLTHWQVPGEVVTQLPERVKRGVLAP